MSQRTFVKNIFRIFGVAAITAIFSSCLKTGTNSNTNGNNVSYITLMNMAPYSSSTEIYFNGDKKTPSISPGSYSTNYGTVPPGTYDIKFKVTGSDSVLSEIPNSNYDSLGFYTLILYNTSPSGGLSSMKVTDDFTTLSLTSANYRFFNLSPDEPAVDLYLNSTAEQKGRSTGDNAYGSYFNSFVPVTSGAYSVTAKKAGSDSVIATIPSVGMVQGNAYTIFLMGSTKNTSNPVKLAVLQAVAPF